MLERKIGKTTWVDLTDPSAEELEQVLVKYEFPLVLLPNCLEQDQLPKHEVQEQTQFLSLRAFDSRMVAILSKPNLILTIHRTPLPYLQSLFETESSEKALIPNLVSRILKTYDAAIKEIAEEFDEIEEAILDHTRPIPNAKVQELYTLKRRVSLLKRILRMSQDPIADFTQALAMPISRDQLEKYLFRLEEVYDNLIAILSLQISISAHRTNEVMRVLTVYSIVFMPLNLIAGIYGMNFEHMPELKWEHGYLMAIIAMVSVGTAILLWLRRRGWLEKP